MEKTIVVIRKHDRIAYILSGVCKFYDISLPELRRTYLKKHLLKRRMAMKLLYDIADLRLKEIAAPLGYQPTFLYNINVHVNTLNDEIRHDKDVRKEYEALLEHMNL